MLKYFIYIIRGDKPRLLKVCAIWGLVTEYLAWGNF